MHSFASLKAKAQMSSSLYDLPLTIGIWEQGHQASQFAKLLSTLMLTSSHGQTASMMN
jgi:hypothetical protein